LVAHLVIWVRLKHRQWMCAHRWYLYIDFISGLQSSWNENFQDVFARDWYSRKVRETAHTVNGRPSTHILCKLRRKFALAILNKSIYPQWHTFALRKRKPWQQGARHFLQRKRRNFVRNSPWSGNCWRFECLKPHGADLEL
jgi:hypothetical protein